MVATEEIAIEALDIYQPVFNFKGRYIHLKGGRSGGRSRFAVQFNLVHLLAWDEFVYRFGWSTYFRGYFMRFVQTDIRESLFRDMCDLIDDYHMNYLFDIQDGPMTIQCRENDNRIISKGFRKSQGSRTAKMKSIAGATHVTIEEADEVESEDFDKMNESLRTMKTEQPQIIMCNNTENPDWFGWSRWYPDGKPVNDPNFLSIHATMYDNLKFTHPSTIQLYESYKQTNPERYRITVLGELAAVRKGQIFTDWEVIDEFPDSVIYGYGLDFGFSIDPTAIVKVAFKGDRLYMDEIVYETGLLNKAITEKCKDKGIKTTDEIICDSEDPKSITDLRVTYDYKLNARKAYKGPNSIEFGYKKMQEYKLFVTRRSKNLIFELRHHCYAEDADGQPTRKPEDKNNHAIDAVRYYVQTKRKRSALL